MDVTITDQLREKMRIQHLLLVSKDVNEQCHYKKLLVEINNFLYKNCFHEWIKDLIDITPEKSIYVTYCPHCESTFRN